MKPDEPKPNEPSLRTAGQRRINLLWEITQTVIALAVVSTAMFVSARIAFLVLQSEPTERTSGVATTAFVLISNSAFLVIGFYFGRTNHQRTGGVNGNDIGR